MIIRKTDGTFRRLVRVWELGYSNERCIEYFRRETWLLLWFIPIEKEYT